MPKSKLKVGDKVIVKKNKGNRGICYCKYRDPIKDPCIDCKIFNQVPLPITAVKNGFTGCPNEYEISPRNKRCCLRANFYAVELIKVKDYNWRKI